MKHLSLVFLLVSLFYAASAAAGSVGERIQRLLDKSPTGTAQGFLDPEQAFIFTAQHITASEVRFSWQIAEGYYLYRDRFAISAGEVVLGPWAPPAGTLKQDESFGEVEVNTGLTQFTVPLPGPPVAAVRFAVQYQGCKEYALCYPPINKTIEVAMIGDPAAGFTTAAATIPPPPAATAVLSAQDQITEKLKTSGLLINIAAFFVFGLLLSLTPCVFPMIPILSGIIVGQSEPLSAARGFALSLVYVLAMALTYAVLGVIAGSLQVNIQAAAQNVWAISFFSAVFVLLAFSMFGFYELQLPAALQTRLSALSNSQTRGSLAGVAIMGAISAVIVGPCVAPPLAGALLYISQTGNAVLGGAALFFMGLGLGVPLLLIGMSAGSLLPKAGIWMQSVKSVFGVLMLAVAIWFLERILPMPVALLLWGSLFIFAAIYLGVPGQRPASGWQKAGKGLGLLMMIYGVSLVVGAIAGADDKWRPLQPFTGTAGVPAEHPPLFKRIASLAELQREIRLAEGDRLMLDFYADWCVTCIEMEKKTFSAAAVREEMEKFVLLQADVTANTADDQALLAHFGLYGPPAIVFFNSQGIEIKHMRLVGFVPADTFARHLRRLLL